MSKRLWNVFYRMLPVSLLETAQPCIADASMDIVIEERQYDGSAKTKHMQRHVKVCHSQNECRHYDVPIDAETGIGKITISDIQEVQHVIVETDESGQQMMDGDDVDITYMVDGEIMEEDSATVFFDNSMAHRCVRIINQQLPPTRVHIVKKLIDMNGETLPFQKDMAFTLCLKQANRECEVTLDASNDFQETLYDLSPGYTMAQEVGCTGYFTRWRMNGDGETADGCFEVLPGDNELLMINEERKETALRIETYHRMANGHLCKPSYGESFQVRVISDSDDRLIELCEENDYSVVLCGLLPGFYDVSEISNTQDSEISYIVNSREECFANVELNACDQACVMIIHTEQDSGFCDGITSPLRICKYIRSKDGVLSKPCEDMQFMVMVSGCGMKETFNLNASNNFCVDIADLCDGEYCIEEVRCDPDYTTSYIINGGCEKTSACVRICADSSFCVSIINEERNSGSLRVCKYVQNEFGDLIKPQKHECFHGTLSSYFCKRTFVLHAANDWCVCFDDLRFGSYEVREEDARDYEVSYQINCGKEMRHARFVIDDSDEHEVRIINRIVKRSCGILKISKFEETRSGEWVKPSGDEEFEVCVESAWFQETYLLKASNNWCVMLEGLDEGEYRIREMDSCGYDVSYIVNQQNCPDAFVYMDGSTQQVHIINRRRMHGMLKLRGVVRACDESMQHPPRGMLMEILVEGRECSEHVTLCADNNWCVLLDTLAPGRYRIVQKDNMGYRVSYVINGQEESFGDVTLQDDDVEVLIVNQETDCAGTLRVTKYMEDEDGNLYMPHPQSDFRFLLQGQGFSRTYRLCARNDFCVYFDDLMEGNYEISEAEDDWDVRYRINGECVDQACIALRNEDVYVDIINREKQDGMLIIEKRIRDGNHIIMPDPDACYRVLLKGKNCHEVIELHAGNEFCAIISNLENQHYEIRELGGGRRVYEINGSLQEDGYILFEGETMHVTIINEEERYGCMLLEKRISDGMGHLSMPPRTDSFCAIIKSDMCTQKVELNAENDFCVRLYDLPQGHYEVQEVECDGYAVSWLINDLPCASAVVDVCDENICITMINTPCPKGTIQLTACVEEDGERRVPSSKEQFEVEVVSEHGRETVCLKDANDFFQQLRSLQPGSYTLRLLQENEVRFVIGDCVFEDVVCIELNGECVEVDVIVTKAHRGDITITKCMEDAFGKRHKPNADASFCVQLVHGKEKQELVLCADNDWTMTLCRQEPGAYEIRERKDGDTRYQINAQYPLNQGYFELKESDVRVTILNKEETMAILHLEAVLSNCDQDLIKPDADMKFTMHICGQALDQTYVLCAENHWHEKLELPLGEYRIESCVDAQFQELYYLVDGIQHCDANITLQQDVHLRAVYVMKCKSGHLAVSKFMRDATCGCLKKPQQEESVRVDIRGDDVHEILTLDSTNHWKEVLPLAMGTYEVQELGKSENVCYIINGGKESKRAVVSVEEELVDVKIINEEALQHHGSIELCKLIRDGNGGYRYPSKDDSYWVCIKGEEDTSRVLLNDANHFYASLHNLKDGWYEIMEESEQTDVTYVVNNAAALPRGIVHVMGNTNTINIINPEESTTGSITLCKYMEDVQGLLSKPMQGSYRIHVSSPGYNEVFTLSQQNNFCETIMQLRPGLYVIDELDHEDVTYIIDGGSQLDHGIVRVENSAHQVQIINPGNEEEPGSITMAKYVRKQGMLMRPTAQETYVFHVSGPSYNQLITLDAANRWMKVISDLKPGSYVIAETTTTDAVSFIINGGSEVDRGVVSVHGENNTVQIIDTPQLLEGSIQLDKYVRREGVLTRPDEEFVSRIHVSRPGFNEIYVLNRENNWSYRIDHLQDGVYVVDEVDDHHTVSYMINGGSEVNSAIVNVEGNANSVQIINTEKETYGSIRIEKYIRKADGTLHRPNSGFTTQVHVSKPGYNEVFTLQEENQWRIVLHDLMDGWYVIDEVDSEDAVTYRINGGSEVAHGIVHVERNTNEVQMIDTARSTLGSLTLAKYIRNDNNQLVLPSDDQRFTITITSDSVNTSVVLEKSNGWKTILRNLAKGTYHIKEQDATNYDVSYVVDNAAESAAAILQLQNDAHHVSIINTQRSGFGKLELTKFIKQANGTLIRPADGDQYTIEIFNATTSRRIELNAGNAFTYVVNDLPQGIYSIREINNTQFKTTFRINGGAETDNAMVTITDTNSNVVEILNELLVNRNTIEVFKYMLDADDNYLPPSAPDTYQFRITGNDIDETYDLHVDNSWHQTLTNYPSGTYTIQEIGSPYPVQYLINSPQLVDEAVFDVEAGMTMVIGIINRLSGIENGSMTLIKRIRDAQGNLIRPDDAQAYVMQVTSPTFTRYVNLDKDNDFTQTLDNLSFGSYQIRETSGSGMVTFIINDNTETPLGRVDVQNGSPNRVIIINANAQTPPRNANTSTVKIVIE